MPEALSRTFLPAFPLRALMMVSLLLAVFRLAIPSCADSDAAERVNYRDCLSCHKGIEEMGPEHGFDCTACHVDPKDRPKDFFPEHQRIIRNPSSPEHVRTFCLPCHREEIRRTEASLHASMAGIVNQTRFLWGAQDRAAPAIYGISGPLKPLPEPDPLLYPEEPKSLVDDFLRRKCLRCHINQAGTRAAGLFRAGGCAACHVLYEDDGRYRGADEAIEPSERGFPAEHRFTKRIPDRQCLHCHNRNHVGADYEGLFEHDYNRAYRSPLREGKPAPLIYGLDYHHLAKDVHAEKGLWCIDCHDRKDLMGDGRVYSYEMEVPKRTCSACHGGFNGTAPDAGLEGMRRTRDGLVFVSKNRNREYLLKLFSENSPGHSVGAHAKVRCSACHAQWSYQDYGLSVIREDLTGGAKWYGLTAQGDPELEKILKKRLENPGRSDSASRDWLTGKERLGIWLSGWRLRRWEYMPLGLDHEGRYAILCPRYQYDVSYVDKLGNVVLDSVIPSRGDGSGEGWAFMPTVPHTIAPFGRDCDRCHRNRVAAGMGIYEELSPDTRLTVPSPPAVRTMRLMSPEERKKLMGSSEAFRKARLRSLMPATPGSEVPDSGDRRLKR